MTDIYEQLRQRLDDMAAGFPATKGGIEIKILKKLFSTADAEMFLMMTPMLESPESVANRLNLPVNNTATHLEDMAKRGLLFRHRKNDQARYSAVPFVVGIFEFQLNRIDRELAEDLAKYYEDALAERFQSWGTPVLRTIPIHTTLVNEWPVAPYEDALKVIDDQKQVAVAQCICRTMNQKIGKGCDKPMEACLIFGSHASYYVDNGMGRFITKDEAKEIVRKNEEAGLVIQPFNSQFIGGMCSCCGCCCGMLRSLKKQDNPAEAVKSNYFAEINAEECTGCETCIDRCQMEAIEMVDDKAVITLKRCIGCGLCVTTCPTDAIRLVKKGDDQLYVPPQTGMETYIRIAQERGKM
jgi:NAD-dependent dihydropyrimidine dehydrogenase PreA subunit